MLTMSDAHCPLSTDPCLVGDPVDTSKGAAVEQTLDFRLTGPLEFWWMRHYDSSQSHHRFALGWGHAHDFDRTLRFDVDGLSYLAPMGRVVGFPQLPNDSDECAREGYLLRRVSPLRYELYRYGEPAMEFEFRELSEPTRLKRLFRGNDEILFGYNAAGRWERIVDSTGRVIRVVEEADGRIVSLTLEGGQDKPHVVLVSYKYDERGNVIATADSSGHGFSCAYDAENRMIRRTGRKGFSFHMSYDSKGRCIKSAGDDRMHEVSLDYDISGRITKVTRADGGVWTYIFDEAGGLAQVIDPLGGVQGFIRDKTGRIVSEVDPNGNATRMVYDAAGALVAKITPFGYRVSLPEDPNAADPRTHRVAANPAEYEYGRPLETDKIIIPDVREAVALPAPFEARSLVVTRPQPRSNHEKSIQARPLGPNWWPEPKQGRVFNDLGKLVMQQDEWGRRRHWSYDASGNVAQYEDFEGSKWSYNCGAWHLRLAETNPLGATVSFSYNTSGELATCTDAGGTCSEYGYNLKDHLVEVKRHGVVRDKYRRDAAGNLVAKYAGDSRLLLQFEIGPGNIPIKRSLASGDEQTFEYDGAGRYVLAATRKDRVEFSYDGFGNRCVEKRNGRGVEHRFHGWGIPAESVFFGRFTVRYERHADGRLVITDPGGKKHQVRFHSHGLVERRFSNNSREVAQYDSQGRCLFKHAQRVRGPVWSRSFHWSGEGELRRVQDNRYGETRHEYDAAHRLRRRLLPGGRVEEYELDLADNLVRQPGLAEVSFQEGNRASTANGESISYNDRNHIAVRQTLSGRIQYAYDSRDQLIRVETPQGSWEAEYDALGRRTRKSWADQTIEYYWNTDQLIAEVSLNGRLRLYIYTDPLALTPVLFVDYDSVDAAPESCRRFFIFCDQIGTPCLVEDETGAEVWRAHIAPFGRAELALGTKIDFNLRFPGHYFDPELGLHYNRFRYYDPGLGRYLQSDPWGIAGGYNLYAYCSNPLLHVDVRGMGEENIKKEKGASEDRPDDETTAQGNKTDELPTKEEALAQAKTDAGIPSDQEPDDVRTVPLTDRNGKQVLDENYQPIYTQEHDFLMPDGSIITIQDHHTGHQFGEGGVGDQGPHFNVRPGDDTRNGIVPGTQPHYPYQDSGNEGE